MSEVPGRRPRGGLGTPVDMGPAEATTTGGTVDGMSEAARLFDQRADPRTNTLVKAVLRAGLGLSMILLVVGLVVQLARGEELALPVKMFKLFAPHPVGEQIMGVGVLVLTLTPALGVLSVVLSWARERDRTYVLVGFAVVCVLFTSVAVGFGFG